jgi:hypothetical protein
MGVGSTSGFASYSDSGKSVGKYFKTAAFVIVEVNVGIALFSPTAGKRRETLQDRSICNYGTAWEDLASYDAVKLRCP